MHVCNSALHGVPADDDDPEHAVDPPFWALPLRHVAARSSRVPNGFASCQFGQVTATEVDITVGLITAEF